MSILFLTYSILLFVALTLVGVLVFYAINKVTHAEWVTDLYPIMKRITTPLWLVLLVLLGVLYIVHREPYFLLRAVGYMAVWVGYRYTLKKFKTLTPHVLFLVIFFLTETPMAWDWLLSLTPEWHSTLFAWQLLSSFLLSGIALITLFSKPEHYSDLGKYLFGFSIFWAYLWFSQYMLIWYANIPEETVYYQTLLSKDYGEAIVAMLILSFALPFLILLSSRAKQKKLLLLGTAVLILLGQYLNFYLMVMPFVK
ncbi:MULTISPECIES: hypothetical protein [Capnocytophaga]|jgi:hypothetical protein|uniref:Uncharacterized protein n=1 Tax=Capnocytophaga ochracea TaxID=1018 RepID=A0A2X2SYD0_CAPOC|nr:MULTISPECIES: hypothetical protein [Capnocytophaga]NWO29581.1 hypothetical protein [Capnocytophaga sp. oral taxon 903]SQA94711.1 Uncharacterised protein [Capnocytophaga ochracea]